MSPFHDDLEAQLRAAATKMTVAGAPGSPPPRRSWLRRGVRAAPALAGVLVTVAVALAALVFIGHGGRSPAAAGRSGPSSLGRLPADLRHPTPRVRQEVRYIEVATRNANAAPTCRGRRRPLAPTFVQSSPGPGLLSELGILRRPVVAADRLPRGDTPGISEIDVRFIRRARVMAGVSYWIVPAHGTATRALPSRGCIVAQRAALERELPQIPAALRAGTLSLQVRLLAYDEAALAPRDTICLVAQGRNMGGYGCGETAPEIAHTTRLENNQNIVSGVLPDGVATVILRYAATGGRPALTVVGRVIGNVLAVTVPGLGVGSFPRQIVWRTESGRVLRTISGTTRGAPAGSAFCQQNPRACGPQSGASSASSTAPLASSRTP